MMSMEHPLREEVHAHLERAETWLNRDSTMLTIDERERHAQRHERLATIACLQSIALSLDALVEQIIDEGRPIAVRVRP